MPSLADLARMTKRRLRRRKVAKAYTKPDNPLAGLDQELEEAAAPNRAPLHPIARGAMEGSGLLSMIRNRGNQQVVNPEDM